MHIVIVGDGKLGHSLARRLAEEGYDIVLVDKNADLLRASGNTLDIGCVCGNGLNAEVLTEAGVPEADLLIAVTSTDEINILCCLVARRLGARHTIARVRDPECAKIVLSMREELGLSMTLNPEQAAATEIARIIRFPSAMKVDFFAKGRVEMVEVKVAAGSPLIGQPLAELYRKFHTRVLVCAVQRDGEVTIPRGDFVLQEGDLISLTATPNEITQLFRVLGLIGPKARTAMIVGGGRVSFYLAQQLIEAGIHVKIIEQNRQRCEELSDKLPRATVILGDGSDRETLREEGMAEADVLVALTGLDEENVVISMYAIADHVRKVIAKINHITFGEILEKTGIECVITPHLIAAGRILRYVRAMQSSVSSSMEALSKIVNEKVEAIEFRVREGFAGRDVPLKELKLKKNLLVASITRGGKLILPSGDDSIQEGDSVVVVTTLVGLEKLDDILA